MFGYVLRLGEAKAARPPVDEAAVNPDAEAAWAEVAKTLTDEARFERGLQAVLEGAKVTRGLP